MWLLGVVVRRYIDFLILLIPTPLVSVLFYSSILVNFFNIQWDFEITKILGPQLFFIIRRYSLLRGIKYIEEYTMKNAYSRHRFSFQY